MVASSFGEKVRQCRLYWHSMEKASLDRWLQVLSRKTSEQLPWVRGKLCRKCSAITITKLSVPGGGFSFGGLTVPKTLAVGQSYTFSISFTPKIKGTQAGSLLVSSNPTNSSLKIGLAGSGGSGTRLSLGTSSLN